MPKREVILGKKESAKSVKIPNKNLIGNGFQSKIEDNPIQHLEELEQEQ